MPSAPRPALSLPGMLMRSKNGRSAGLDGTGLSFPSHITNRGAFASPKTKSSFSPLSTCARAYNPFSISISRPRKSLIRRRRGASEERTAMVRTGSDGWKLLGPSSQRYPSSGRSTVVMLPPGRARASVTSTSPTPCRVASACAVQRPLMPPPTTTQSADSRAPVEAGASAAPPATAAQRTLSPRWRSRAGLRVPLSSGAAADAAVAMAVAATIPRGVAELRARARRSG